MGRTLALVLIAILITLWAMVSWSYWATMGHDGSLLLIIAAALLEVVTGALLAYIFYAIWRRG